MPDTTDDAPCQCWKLPAAFHGGHCCFWYPGFEAAARGEQPFCHDQPDRDEMVIPDA